MSGVERGHIVAAFRFELGKVVAKDVRARMVAQLNRVDHVLAALVAEGIGFPSPAEETPPNHGKSSPALSQLTAPVQEVATRTVAVLVADSVDSFGTRRLVDGQVNVAPCRKCSLPPTGR